MAFVTLIFRYFCLFLSCEYDLFFALIGSLLFIATTLKRLYMVNKTCSWQVVFLVLGVQLLSDKLFSHEISEVIEKLNCVLLNQSI